MSDILALFAPSGVSEVPREGHLQIADARRVQVVEAHVREGVVQRPELRACRNGRQEQPVGFHCRIESRVSRLDRALLYFEASFAALAEE
jgi:hypothetical protein